MIYKSKHAHRQHDGERCEIISVMANQDDVLFTVRFHDGTVLRRVRQNELEKEEGVRCVK